MSFFSLLLIAFSLAMDAFAVSVSAGFFFRRVFFRQAFLLAVTFGIFQAVMPLLGWIGGSLLYDLIARYSRWIAFLLLSFIGVNMIHEALSDKDEGKKEYLSLRSLILLGVATSIDALIVRISFALFPIDIYFAVSVIGFVTFVLCFF